MKRIKFPIYRDPTNKFLPWIIACMVFLANLAVIGFILVNQVLAYWSDDVEYQLSIQVPRSDSISEDKKKINSVIAMLGKDPIVKTARLLEQNEINNLLKPWFSDSTLLDDLPIPYMIDVIIKSRTGFDIEQMRQSLSELGAGIVVDDHSAWLNNMINFFSTLKFGAFIIALITMLALIAIVIFTTRVGISVHHDMLEVLHFMGASNNYIASQFSYQATKLSFLGCLIGILFSVPVCFFLYNLGQSQEYILKMIHVKSSLIVILILVPSFIAMIISKVTAWFTVLFVLYKLSW